MTYKEATRLAKEELEAERLQIRDVTAVNGEKAAPIHLEDVA